MLKKIRLSNSEEGSTVASTSVSYKSTVWFFVLTAMPDGHLPINLEIRTAPKKAKSLYALNKTDWWHG